jgi:hypothetical protein
MPLSFQSLSHGEVAFGFFNIETDMVLLNQYFFFAREFSGLVARLAKSATGRLEGELKVYTLKEGDRGSLMWAIQGNDLRGLIGETYRLYPFPGERDAFKQNPEGDKTREVMEYLAGRYSALSSLSVMGKSSGAGIAIGEYSFSRRWFHELIKYIWMGGYPRWKDGIHPPYVLDMKESVEKSTHPLFGLTLTG